MDPKNKESVGDATNKKVQVVDVEFTNTFTTFWRQRLSLEPAASPVTRNSLIH
jgi:hypothetical protein